MPHTRNLRPMIIAGLAWLAGFALAIGLMRASAAPPGDSEPSAAQICQCGNNVCQPLLCGENSANCPADCAPSPTPPVCGDGVCQDTESALTCPADCLLPTSTCGNGVCDSDEGPLTCPDDCPRPTSTCGNGVCDPDEGPVTCPADCVLPTLTCGNGVCDSNEGPLTCPQDCADILPVCGDGVCDPIELCRCSADCVIVGFCGDNVCGVCENSINCFRDCRPTLESPTRTPTATRLPTRTPTPAPTDTESPPVDQPTATDQPSAEASQTLTPSPSAGTGQTAPQAELSSGCLVVPASQMDAEVRAALERLSGVEATDWVICQTPPNHICLPLAEPPRGALTLFDCTADGGCDSFAAGGPEEDIICMGSAQSPVCDEGCVFARRVLILGLSPEEATGGAAVLLVLLFGGPLKMMGISRRRERRDQFDEYEEAGPVDAWDGL